MYPRPIRSNVPKQAVLVLVALAGSLTLAGIDVPVAAKSSHHHNVSIKSVSFDKLPIPADLKKRKEPTTVELYQQDRSPLAGRKVLLLVHGLRGEFWPHFRWDKVVASLEADQEFNKQYKIYLVRYNTHVKLEKMTPQFQTTVNDIFEGSGRRPITMLALSMGGNLIQQAMEQESVAQKVEKVITMGTPFHGSPLFSYDWMSYSMLKTHIAPWVKLDLCLAYRAYFGRHKNLLSDLSWDNSDSLIPTIGKYKAKFPMRFRGEVTPSMANAEITKLNESLKTDKKKFITYGAYLVTPFVNGKRPSHIANAVEWPFHFATTTVPEHMAREHPVLRALNYQIADIVTHDNAKVVSDSNYAYALNDGITPVQSAIFLPTQKLTAHTLMREADLPALKHAVDVRRARVFRNIDHVSFVDGYKPMHGTTVLSDQLAPEDGKKTIFQWIIDDILHENNQIAETAAPSGRSESKNPAGEDLAKRDVTD